MGDLESEVHKLRLEKSVLESRNAILEKDAAAAGAPGAACSAGGQSQPGDALPQSLACYATPG